MKSGILYFIALALALILSNSAKTQTINLRSAANFTLFTSSGAFDNTGATVIMGDIGTNVGAISGFPPGVINGSAYAANSITAQAVLDLDTTYAEMSAITCGTTISVTLGAGQTLVPGVYCTTAASSLSGDLTLNAQGDPNAIFIIKTGGALTVANFSRILLTDSAYICNVYWQIDGAFTLGDSSLFQGNLLVNGASTLLSGSSLFGRSLSINGAVELHGNFVQLDDTCTIHNVLPITLLYFTSRCDDKKTKLYWATASETDNDYFSIEKFNMEELRWLVIENTKGAGNSSEVLYYTFTDPILSELASYYRLKQTDYNGNFAYSNPLISQVCQIEEQPIIVHPNPTTGKFQIYSISADDEETMVTIYNSFGTIMLKEVHQKGIINLQPQPNGIYMIQLTNPHGTHFKKIVLHQ